MHRKTPKQKQWNGEQRQNTEIRLLNDEVSTEVDYSTWDEDTKWINAH